MSDSPSVELELRRVLPSPFAEILHAFEPFARLGELKNSVIVVDLVRDVLVTACWSSMLTSAFEHDSGMGGWPAISPYEFRGPAGG